MTKSNMVDLEKALLKGVLDCGFGLPISQENAHFDKPTDKTPWLSAFTLYNPSRPVTLGEGGEDEVTGLIQVDINVALMSGKAATNALVGLAAAFFKPGRVLPFLGTSANVSAFGRPRSAQVEGWYRTTLTVAWYARIAR